MKSISLLVVDTPASAHDSIAALAALETIRPLPAPESVADALAMLARERPDVVLLSLDIEGVDVAGLYSRMMEILTVPVVLVANAETSNASEAFQLLEHGAFTYLQRPSHEGSAAVKALYMRQLTEAISHAAISHCWQGVVTSKRGRPIHYKTQREGLPLVAIAATAGSIEPLKYTMSRMPTICPPIIIGHHFTGPIAKELVARLNSISLVTVVEATNGAILQNGYAYVVPAGKQLALANRANALVCHLMDGPIGNALDVMFFSVSSAAGSDAVAVMLSGETTDGVTGFTALHRAGAFTMIEQDAMAPQAPQAAMRARAVSASVIAQELPMRIIAACYGRNERIGPASAAS